MTHAIDEMVRVKQELDLAAKTAKVFFVDKQFSLDQRWAWFEALADAKLLPNEGYGDGHVGVLDKNLSLYDDFCVEKYETKSYTDMLESIEEEGEYAVEQIDVWKEAVLAGGYGSFTNDW